MAVTKAGADSGRRALEVLFALTQQRPRASVRDLAEQLDIPMPSVHRYVALLRDMGLLEEGARGQYHLTMRVAALGRAARAATSVVDVAGPFMSELSEQVGETVLLARLVQGLPVCIHRIETTRSLRLSFEVGQHLPALRGASVRLLLGALSVPEQRRHLQQALANGERLPDIGPDEFLSAIERDAERGWAISYEEIDEGVWAAAAPVVEDGRTVAALSVPCPAFRLTDEHRAEILDLVRKTAHRLSEALG
jgi:DNA-binding IclR family transcriptional regulator